MRNNDSSAITRLTIFVGGVAILLFAFIMCGSYVPGGSSALTFAIIDAIILYLLFFGPLLLGDRISTLTGGRLVSSGIYWLAVGLYALLTAYVLYNVLIQPHPPLRLYFILQLVGLFGLMLASYFGNAAHEQILDVEDAQYQSLSQIRNLRDASRQLAATVKSLDGANDPSVRKLSELVGKIAEELRYLSPVQSTQAYRMERDIEADLEELSAVVGSGFIAASAQDACGLARQTLTLIEQRKQLLN